MRPLGALVRRGTEQPFGEVRGRRSEVRESRTASALGERSYRTVEQSFGGRLTFGGGWQEKTKKLYFGGQ
jgi:hypothetical protein